MLSESQTEKLKANWGAKADALACYAEVRLFDPCSAWQCFILAMNPQDEDEIHCIIQTSPRDIPEICIWNREELSMLFNIHGEPVQIDTDYRPMQASQLLKKLSELTIYERTRD